MKYSYAVVILVAIAQISNVQCACGTTATLYTQAGCSNEVKNRTVVLTVDASKTAQKPADFNPTSPFFSSNGESQFISSVQGFVLNAVTNGLGNVGVQVNFGGISLSSSIAYHDNTGNHNLVFPTTVGFITYSANVDSVVRTAQAQLTFYMVASECNIQEAFPALTAAIESVGGFAAVTIESFETAVDGNKTLLIGTTTVAPTTTTTTTLGTGADGCSYQVSNRTVELQIKANKVAEHFSLNPPHAEDFISSSSFFSQSAANDLSDNLQSSVLASMTSAINGAGIQLVSGSISYKSSFIYHDSNGYDTVNFDSSVGSIAYNSDIDSVVEKITGTFVFYMVASGCGIEEAFPDLTVAGDSIDSIVGITITSLTITIDGLSSELI